MLIIPVEKELLQPGSVDRKIRNASASFDTVNRALTVKTELMSDFQRVVRQYDCQHAVDDEIHSLVQTCVAYDDFISISSVTESFVKEGKLVAGQDTRTNDGNTIPGCTKYRYETRNQYSRQEPNLKIEATLSAPYSFNDRKYQVSKLEMSYDPMIPEPLRVSAIYAHLFGKDHKELGIVYDRQNCGNKFLFEDGKLTRYENRYFKMGFDTQSGLYQHFEALASIKPNEQQAFQKYITEFFEESEMLVTIGKTLHSDIRKELRLDLQ